MATDERLLTTAEAAEILGVSENTLVNWRAARRGPAFVKIGHGTRCHVRYRAAAVRAYFIDVPTVDQPVSPVGDTVKGGGR